MRAPDPQTLTARSGPVPQCAKRGEAIAFLLVLLSACLNPRPEEFPSNDDMSAVIGTPGSSSGDNNEASGPPVGSEQEDPGYNIIGDGAGSGGSGGDLGQPLPQTPTDDSSSGEGEPAAPDAGADAGAPSAELTGEDTSTEGQAVP